MCEPFLCLGLGRRFHCAPYLAALQLLMISQVARGEPAPNVADIRAAWQARHERIHSYEYDCEQTETLFNIKRYAAFDPFSGSKDGDPNTGEIILPRIDLGRTATFRRDGNNTSYQSSGQQWDHQLERRKYFSQTTAFDGSQTQSLLEGIVIAARLIKSATPDGINTNQVVLYLWQSPLELLESLAFQPDKMTISNPRVAVDDIQCVELTIPRGSNRWKGLLYVDPSRDYLPVRFSMQLDGVVTSERTIRYTKDDAGWVIASWIDRRFTEKGHPETVTKSTVTRAAINEPSSAGDFTIELPVGTRVTQRDGDKTLHFVVLSGGERRQVNADAIGEFKNPDDRFVALQQRIKSVGTASPTEREEFFADLRRYVRDPASMRTNAWELLESTARQLHSSAGPEAALTFCRDFSGDSDVCRQCLPPIEAAILGQQRRASLVGRQIELTGNTIDGKPFDWTPFAGKTVLVDFWFTGCGPCRKDLPWLKQLYDAHHDHGFAIVGISVDTDASVLTTFLEQEKIPWSIIHEPEQSPDTNTVRYDVHSFPTYILVDPTGKVTFAGSRNDKLQSLLDDTLNP